MVVELYHRGVMFAEFKMPAHYDLEACEAYAKTTLAARCRAHGFLSGAWRVYKTDAYKAAQLLSYGNLEDV